MSLSTYATNLYMRTSGFFELMSSNWSTGLKLWGPGSSHAGFYAVSKSLRKNGVTLDRLRHGKMELTDGLLQKVADAVDVHATLITGHSIQVARYTRAIAEVLGLAPVECNLVHNAALLHDVGKLGIPDSVLLKPGALTELEFEYVRAHPVLGAEVLSRYRVFQDMIPIIRHHHERYDGSGYPDCLHGDQIPLGARIIAAVDAVDAMASDRPYRKGLPPQVILVELIRQSGKQFDPQVVDILLELAFTSADGFIVNSARISQISSNPVLWLVPSQLA